MYVHGLIGNLLQYVSMIMAVFKRFYLCNLSHIYSCKPLINVDHVGVEEV